MCFRFATHGPFQKAWKLMKNNPESSWSSADDAISRIIADPTLAMYLVKSSSLEEYKNCLINHIPTT